MLNVLGWLILGALVGWLGSRGLPSRRSRRRNLVIAISGAVLGGLWFSWPDVGAVTSSEPRVNLSGLFIAFLGAISVLTITSVIQHGRDRAPAG